jgi:hypothetical protein
MKGGRDNSRTQQSNRNSNENIITEPIRHIIPIRIPNNTNNRNNRNNNENIINNNENVIIRRIRSNTNLNNNIRNVRTRSNSRTRSSSGSNSRNSSGSNSRNSSGSNSRSSTGSNSRSSTGSNPRSRTGSNSRSRTGSNSRSRTGSNSPGTTEIYGDRNNCSICFGRLTSRGRRILECRHAFHTRCINRYCTTVSNCRCPICRTPITN